MISNFSDEVVKQASNDAKRLLSKDLQRAIRINKSAGSVTSPSIDGMPKGSHRGNGSEEIMLLVSECRQLIRDVSSALSMLDADEFQALQDFYIHDKTATRIAQNLYVSRTQIYRIINRGINEFVDYYRGGELLVIAKRELEDKLPA
ncbi:hypothetical protein [Limosilactobacillus oris]|uniref:hypothetical protein n=1 Tax=Limosilactobacillus oris TaxID=1632 RepID=UPI0024B3310B|nr:hypothetical protein [Limosilactobacillus oris]WHO86398.1 hypothetical protein QLX69_04120 [Limosilactobacillus oris]